VAGKPLHRGLSAFEGTLVEQGESGCGLLDPPRRKNCIDGLIEIALNDFDSATSLAMTRFKLKSGATPVNRNVRQSVTLELRFVSDRRAAQKPSSR
jgi:hypothetical protein